MGKFDNLLDTFPSLQYPFWTERAKVRGIKYKLKRSVELDLAKQEQPERKGQNPQKKGGLGTRD